MSMKITLNGQEKELENDLNLEKLIEKYCKYKNHIVAEVNGVTEYPIKSLISIEVAHQKNPSLTN